MATRWNSKTEEKHPYHGGDGRKEKSRRCRKCMLGDDYRY